MNPIIEQCQTIVAGKKYHKPARKQYYRKTFAESCPDLLAEFDRVRYKELCGLTPETLPKLSSRMVPWICSKCGHKWFATVRDRVGWQDTAGSGCPKCEREARKMKARNETPGALSERLRARQLAGDEEVERLSIARQCPEIAFEWHNDKNPNLDKNQTAWDSKVLVWWVCRASGGLHEYLRAIYKRTLYGQHCPYCDYMCRRFAGIEFTLQAYSPALSAMWSATNSRSIDQVDYGEEYYAEWICSNKCVFKARVCDMSHVRRSCPCNDSIIGKRKQKADEWLASIAMKEGIMIRIAGRPNEYQVPGTDYWPSGYCQENNTIYEFWSNYESGKCDNEPNEINPLLGVSYGELRRRVLERLNTVQSMGYRIVVMWEAEWDKVIKKPEWEAAWDKAIKKLNGTQ